ncbi:poly [ADP-ribose] polymerase 1-like [Actinia tenebrosa]|uniref:Poly [ADP-ribose] polymerase n=1 Tax=Actinia tenebrosa TaxID=6105 RepID=A0A6P8IJR9_ACTTE|nr:poly [ADP-ribose] polymerase 1-like [Actinia tenebrosa]
MAEDILYKAEYAKSNRSSCKLCKVNIGKESLRVAKMVQSPHFDGKVPNWFHYSCFFKKIKPASVSDIAGVDSLRWEDQEKIKNNVGGATKSGAASSSTNTTKLKEDKDLIAEYAKSSRSSCKGCEEKIEKGELRLAKMMEPSAESNAPMGIGLIPRWHHVDCFVEECENLEVDSSITAECFTGFNKLEKTDQDMLKKKLGASKDKKKSSGKGKKRKVEEEEKPQKKQKTAEEEAEEKALKEQSKLVWKIRDELNDNCPLMVLRQMLEDNGLSSQGGEASLLDRCADGMAFGRLLPCEECNNGTLVYRHDCYGCTGNMSEWTKCMFVTQDPKRANWVISKELKEEVEYLKKFKFVKRKRLFPKASALALAQKADGSETASSNSAPPDKPLFNQKIALIGKLKKSKANITEVIESLGGKVVEKVSNNVSCCISSAAEVNKQSKKMKDAESANIPVVSEECLDAVKSGGAVLKISQHSIAPWGNNKGVSTVDGPPPSLKKKSSSSHFPAGDIEKKIKLSVKGGAAVDPESGKEDSCHVLQVKGDIYNAILGLVDIVRGTNSYYKLQILEKDHGPKCYLFRSWGRVGTSIGGNKLESFSRGEAISRFCELYEEKTGNSWHNRKSFVKHPNRFFPLEIDYGQDEEELKKHSIAAGSQSKLHLRVQELIKMIFDVESMKKAMVEFEIDLKKMPLGKLTRRQIERAYTTLGEAQKIISEGGNRNALLDASNRFYTLIPHDFGMKNPPMLDNMDLINSKVSMLDNLLEIEVAYSLLKSGGDDAKDPIDVNYEKLKTNLDVLEHSSPEFVMIQEYVKNTHAATHQQYELNVLDIFKVDRHGEASRYKPFKELHNRQLLWHGSSVTNYAGILSQGLRIAPPEAPVTGYMFGKGVYFADMVSKSANYCRTTPTNNVGLLMLCEVALGNMHELKAANFVTKPPKGKHSVKGLGRTAPDCKGHNVLEDGTIVPMGKGVESNVKDTSLLYNEYIVYDVSQINIKYLLKLEFKYKYGW